MSFRFYFLVLHSNALQLKRLKTSKLFADFERADIYIVMAWNSMRHIYELKDTWLGFNISLLASLQEPDEERRKLIFRDAEGGTVLRPAVELCAFQLAKAMSVFIYEADKQKVGRELKTLVAQTIAFIHRLGPQVAVVKHWLLLRDFSARALMTYGLYCLDQLSDARRCFEDTLESSRALDPEGPTWILAHAMRILVQVKHRRGLRPPAFASHRISFVRKAAPPFPTSPLFRRSSSRLAGASQQGRLDDK